MNINRQACNSYQLLSKATLLALLPSKIDESRAIVKNTGEIIDISQFTLIEIQPYLNNGNWIYYEENLPRRMLLTNPNWSINSFDPVSKQVCVSIYAKSGKRELNFTLSSPTVKF